jgi:hypothetical protein
VVVASNRAQQGLAWQARGQLAVGQCCLLAWKLVGQQQLVLVWQGVRVAGPHQ